jgi:hypothetical protein
VTTTPRPLIIFEHKLQPPISPRAFALRMARQGGYASMLIAGSVIVGVAGYHWVAGFTWVDSFLNACMLLGGMGPVGDLPNSAAKIFAGVFALYAGLVFVVVAGLLLAPMFHRVIHRFHWDAGQHEAKS